MRDLEDKCADLTNESEKLKSLADISERQTSFLLQQMNTNDYELSAMRKQLINLQVILECVKIVSSDSEFSKVSYVYRPF